MREKIRKCIELVEKGNLENGVKTFRMYYLNNMGYIDQLFELMLEYFESVDYNKLYICFDLALSIDDSKYIKDIKFYLYMLNYITNIPDRYKELINGLYFDIVKVSSVDSERYFDISFENNYRHALISRGKVETSSFSWNDATVYQKLSYKIGESYYRKKCSIYRIIYEYIEKQDYVMASILLIIDVDRRGCTENLCLLYELACYVLRINLGDIPIVSDCIPNDIFSAVRIRNFDFALQLKLKENPRDNDLILLFLKHINELLDDNKDKIDNGDIEGEFDVFISLINSSDIDTLHNKFLEYYSKNPGCLDRLFRLILRYINMGNYSMVFSLFELVILTRDDKYIRDIKFYLYMLNYITDIPENFKALIDGLTLDDVLISGDDSRYTDVLRMNQLRKNELKGSYSNFRKIKCLTDFDLISFILHSRVVHEKDVFYYELSALVCSDKYAEAKALIDKENQRKNISLGLFDTYSLINIVLDINNGKLPDVSDSKVDSFRDAIKIGNFKLAYKLLDSKSRKNSINLVVLRKIIGLLNAPLVLDSGEKRCIDIYEISSIITNCNFNNYDFVISKIQNFLEHIGMIKYFGLLLNLLKLALFQIDYELIDLSLIVEQILKGNYEFDYFSFETKFYDAISSKDVIAVSCYYNIIASARDGLMQLNGEYMKNITRAYRSFIKDYCFDVDCILGVLVLIYRDDIGVVDACLELGLDDDKRNRVLLYFAKEYYSVGNYLQGDQFMTVLNKAKGKSGEVKRLVSEVNKNKLFYINRRGEHQKSFGHVLVPNRRKKSGE